MSKKYNNPVNKPVMVKVSRWEYAAQVASATTLEILEALVEDDKPYIALDVLKTMCKVNGGEEK